MEAESDTGGGKQPKIEDEKDKRIKALEEEVARLRERERQLMQQVNSVNDL